MQLLKWILLLSLIVMTIGGSKKASSSKKSSSGSRSSSTSTPSQTISNDDLCGCYDIELMCDPIEINNEICYYYQINRVSDNDYCLDAINYLVLSSGDNLDECGLSDSDINDITLDYAPKCYDIDTLYSSTNINGIKLTLNNGHGSSQTQSSSYDSSKSSKTSSKGGRRRRLGGGSSSKKDSSGKKSSSGDSGGSSQDTDTDFVIFSACFDGEYVDGTQDNGIIEISQGNNLFTCDFEDTLPNFCGAVETSEGEGTSGSGSDYEGSGSGGHQGLVNQEIAHESSHQVVEDGSKETKNNFDNLTWEIPVGAVIFVGLIIIAGIYYARTVKERKRMRNEVEENENSGSGTKFSAAVNNYNIRHLSRLSLSSISEAVQPKLKDNLTVQSVVDDICDPVTPVPCSPQDAFDAMDGIGQSPFDTMDSPFGICEFIDEDYDKDGGNHPDPEIPAPLPTNASPEMIKMQTEINDIYANIGIRHRETF